jgi:hypothetical protein
MNLVFICSGAEKPAAAALTVVPGNILEMQITQPCPHLQSWKLWLCGSAMCFNKPVQMILRHVKV